MALGDVTVSNRLRLSDIPRNCYEAFILWMLWRVAPRRGGWRFASNSRGYVVESGFTLQEVELIGQELLRCWCKRRKECSLYPSAAEPEPGG
jgi:hypothetical protein